MQKTTDPSLRSRTSLFVLPQKTTFRVSGLAPEKGGKLNAETATEEMLDSSKSVLQNYRGRGTRGLQQFFSPTEAAQLTAKVFGRVATLDLTAGNGALLDEFPEELRFGVEIDPDQTKNANYNALTGDIQKAYPLMRKIGFEIDAIALNPPFGLTWNDESLTWEMLIQLEADDLITISEKTKEIVAQIIAETQKQICPLYPVKPQQRLGFLSDLEHILCIKDEVRYRAEPHAGFMRVERLTVSIAPAEYRGYYQRFANASFPALLASTMNPSTNVSHPLYKCAPPKR